MKCCNKSVGDKKKGSLWVMTDSDVGKFYEINATQLSGFEMMIKIGLKLTWNIRFKVGSTDQ